MPCSRRRDFYLFKQNANGDENTQRQIRGVSLTVSLTVQSTHKHGIAVEQWHRAALYTRHPGGGEVCSVSLSVSGCGVICFPRNPAIMRCHARDGTEARSSRRDAAWARYAHTEPLQTTEHGGKAICQGHGCSKRPVYGFRADGKKVACLRHAHDEMTNLESKECTHKGCHITASFGFRGRAFCRAHAEDGMSGPRGRVLGSPASGNVTNNPKPVRHAGASKTVSGAATAWLSAGGPLHECDKVRMIVKHVGIHRRAKK